MAMHQQNCSRYQCNISLQHSREECHHMIMHDDAMAMAMALMATCAYGKSDASWHALTSLAISAQTIEFISENIIK
jgi:hypothetical protein